MWPHARQRTMLPSAVPNRVVVGISPSWPTSPATDRCGSSWPASQTTQCGPETPIARDVKVDGMGAELPPFRNEPILELRRGCVRAWRDDARGARGRRLRLQGAMILSAVRVTNVQRCVATY